MYLVTYDLVMVIFNMLTFKLELQFLHHHYQAFCTPSHVFTMLISSLLLPFKELSLAFLARQV